MRCSKCGAENRETAKFCDGCGAQLPIRCASCGALSRVGARFCDACGMPLSETPVRPPATTQVSATVSRGARAEVVEGERKTVTALFADIKGSTELIRELDPEEAQAIVDPVLQLMMAAVHRYDGYVAQSTGDGIFAMFGAPVAHEDHPQRALHAALAIQDELRRYGEKTKAAGRPALEARIGINTGEVVLRLVNTGQHTEYSPVGHAANLAARLQTVAPVGGVIVSDDTRRLVEDYFELRHLGPATLKGIAEPVNVYEVMSTGPSRGHFDVAARRGLTKFVGREHELAQMRRAAELAIAGNGQLVAVVADAGAGKSRLVHEFKALLPSGCKLLEAYSVSHGRASPWLPVLELLRGYFSLQNADDAAVRRERVRAALGALDPALGDTAPYLWNLLAIQEDPDPLAQMDAEVKHRRTLEAIKRIILRESLNQPLVVIFEDLHWIDSETQALLDLLADSISGARLLLVVNYRPEYRHKWSGRSHYLQLRLDPLGAENAMEMLRALLGEDTELDPLKRLIAERTGGNPFFIEEVVQALFEQGVLARNGIVKLVQPLANAHLPVTVQGVLAARIDGMPAPDKELLQTLAVIGIEFTLTLARELTKLPYEELERGLANLRFGEFIYEHPALCDVEYAFKHALTHEVAYNSLLLERRKALHERTAQALEARFVDSIEEHLADLSYHYSRSGNDSRAIDYLIRAAEQANQRSAYSQAALYLQQALTRLSNQPAGSDRYRKEFAIHAGLADSAIVMSGYAAPEYEHHLTRRHELAQRLGDTAQIFYSLVGMSVLSAFRLELSKVQDIGRKLWGIADQEQDPEMQLQAHGSLANVLWLSGDITGSHDHAEKGLRLFKPEQYLAYGNEHMRAACHFYAANSTTVLGLPDKGLQQALEFLAWAREQPQLISLIFALYGAATILAFRGEGSQALKHADDLLALTAEHGFSNWHSFGQLERGLAVALSGN